MKLTRAEIKKLKLPKDKDDCQFFDDEVTGFTVRLRAGGSRKFYFRYKLGNRTYSIPLGNVGALDVDEARRMAKVLYGRVAKGENPAAEKAEVKARSDETFGQVVKTYLTWKRSQVRTSTYRDIARHLEQKFKALHPLHIGAIDRRTIAAQLSKMATEAPTQCNRARGSLSAFFDWARGEGLVEHNPVEGTVKQVESKSRDRVLSDDEVRRLWKALGDAITDYSAILKILLLTGAREAEIARLRWSEIDLDRGVIELPPERTKNHRRHIVPISDEVRRILSSLDRRDDRDLVFGKGDGGFSGWSKSKNRLDAVLKISEWRLHDLRRTAATGMGELGVMPHVIEAVIGHVSGVRAGVSGTYNRSKLEKEKARALAMWSAHVVELVENRQPKVVPMRPASGSKRFTET
jgi:integrase